MTIAPADVATLPIPMLLWCPSCGQRHVDDGDFATKLHHTHACQRCGMVWRPALCSTVGVRFLPGFKNAAAPRAEPPATIAARVLEVLDASRMMRTAPEIYAMLGDVAGETTIDVVRTTLSKLYAAHKIRRFGHGRYARLEPLPEEAP